MGLPLAILSTLLTDPAARKRYLRTCTLQMVLTIAVSLCLLFGSKSTAELFDGEPFDADTSYDEGPRSSVEHDSRAGTTVKRALVFWSSLYGTLCAVEWLIIALSFEHHDAISRDAALFAGIPPEDPPRTPRIRVSPTWIRKRLKRKLRGFLAFISGLPVLALLLMVPLLGRELYSLATAAWGAYWISVFVGARSGQAWKEETTAPPPWFLRHALRFTDSVPGFRWWLPRLFCQLCHRLTASVFSPAARFERSPYELAGLALMRTLCSLPGMYPFMRPLVPVAAAHILLLGEPHPEQQGSGRDGSAIAEQGPPRPNANF